MGPSVVFDTDGSATGQIPHLLTQSWIGNSYQIGTIESVTATAKNPATTFAALSPGGNFSGTPTAVHQEWFPDLPSCPGASTPCAKQAMQDALLRLRTKLFNSCAVCAMYVFNITGSNQRQFQQYLSRSHRLFDGTRSNAPITVFCQSGWYPQLFCPYTGDGTVSAFMANKTNMASAVSQTPSDRNDGPMIFFDPQVICNSVSGDSKELLNEAALFHEALHGYTGSIDSFLQSEFGLSEAMPSVNITYYLDENVLGGNLLYSNDLPTDPGPMQCPN